MALENRHDQRCPSLLLSGGQRRHIQIAKRQLPRAGCTEAQGRPDREGAAVLTFKGEARRLLRLSKLSKGENRSPVAGRAPVSTSWCHDQMRPNEVFSGR